MLRKTALALAGLGLLAACFQMEQEAVISEDGTTTLTVELSIDAAILAMSKNGQGTDYCEMGDASNIPDEVRVDAVQSTSRGDHICTITMTGPTGLVFSSFDPSSLAPSERENPGDAMMQYSEVGDTKRIDIEIHPMPQSAEADETFTNMLIGMVSGRFLSWTVTAPEILDTNGSISADGKTVSFNLPVATMLTNETEVISYYLEFKE